MHLDGSAEKQKADTSRIRSGYRRRHQRNVRVSIKALASRSVDFTYDLCRHNMAATKSTASELRALADLINNAVTQIENACESRSQTYPLADEPFTPQSEAARMSPDVLEAGNIIVAAASQLVSAVRIPALTLSVTASYVSYWPPAQSTILTPTTALFDHLHASCNYVQCCGNSSRGRGSGIAVVVRLFRIVAHDRVLKGSACQRDCG